MTPEPFHSHHASHPAKRLTVFVEYADRARRRPIYFEILKRTRRAKLAGMTVFQGDVGYGLSGRLHHTRHLLIDDAPLSIVMIDRPERIDSFLEEIGDLIAEAFVLVVDVEVIET
jgi:uncharacterized protein